MSDPDAIVDVTRSGAVLLGDSIVCDGFFPGYPYRVQSHVHADHMDQFEESKGQQNIIFSPETFEILKIIKNADIPYRSNLMPIQLDEKIQLDNISIELKKNGHMLGSVQTKVTYENGMSVGYSGDFSGNIENVIHVDTLVVDATYGNPESQREYSHEDVVSSLIELIVEKSREGPINLRAHSGTLQQALDIITSESIELPIVAADKKTLDLTKIHQSFGYSTPHIYYKEDRECEDILGKENYILISSLHDSFPCVSNNMTTVALTAFMVPKKDPVLEYSKKSYKVGFTCHADFNETLKYIEKTGAQNVITDNTRGPYAVDLAIEIENRLGIDAKPSSYT